MQDIFETLIDLFTEHWIKVLIGALFLVFGWVIGWWRARRKWLKKEFFDRVNFSLNSIVDGRLMIRTIMEKSADDVFLNSIAVQQLLAAATTTSKDNPLIQLPADDYWYFLNAALNEISEKFAVGFVMRDIGAPVRMRRFLICLTNESDGAIRTRKIRVMMVQQSVLESLPETMPQLESENHETRWNTLQIMAQRLKTNPSQFMAVELLL
ncbi:MAG: hypothetical protein R3C03_08530 [Pirellulaceae bacterium]